MRILELFAGIGACSKALKRIGIDIEIVDAVEIDRYAIKSFNAIHGTDFEVQDIKEWNKDLKDIDLITHGSPCQDFSIAGKQAGGDLGSGTRSSLMYETIRIVGKIIPKYVLWENVKNILSKKHKHNFDAYIETMDILGYNSYYQVLNAKDYGIPQNRERVYTVSIRKDIDKGYKLPEPMELKLRLKDVLEDEVEEKYYLDDERVKKIISSNFMQEKKRVQEKDVCDTLLARDWKDPKCVRIGGIFDTDKSKHQAGSIYDKEGLSPTLDVAQGGWRQPSIITYNIPQTVKVRKYNVDTNKLQQVLKEHKKYSNKEIALILNLPITTVEHWFRNDNCFSIPDSQIWLRLKSLLNIETNEFDESIMTFEEKGGVYDKANRIYDENGLSPTLTQQEEKILIKNATKKGYDEAIDGDSVNLQYPNSKTRRGRVGHQVSQTLMANDSIGVVEKVNVIGNYMPSGHDASRIVDSNGLAPTVKENHGTVTATNIDYRIRKLTPKECWRLMGFDDEDFEKAQEVPTSNTQLYKQAGNSIVVNVLEKIFKNLF